jgi:quinol monooxygenase YgiN
MSQEAKQKGNEAERDSLMVRMAEIEIDSNYVQEYVSILQKEADLSVELEPGVICIYPMFVKEKPTSIRLLEIYASKDAYESHLQTPHFKHYKEATLKMVKDLKLIEMEAISPGNMPIIFKKLNP